MSVENSFMSLMVIVMEVMALVMLMVVVLVVLMLWLFRDNNRFRNSFHKVLQRDPS